MLVFIFAGVYKLTMTGWRRSIKMCCRRPPSSSATGSLASSIQKYVTDAQSDSNSSTSDSEEEELLNTRKIVYSGTAMDGGDRLLHPV